MKEYIITMITVTALCAIVSALSPEGELGKHIRLVAGLCTLCVMISPISRAISFLSEFELEEIFDPEAEEEMEDEYESIFENYIEEYRIENTKVGIAEMLSARYGKSTENFEIYLKISEQGELERVTVLLCGNAIFLDSRDIEEYLSEILGCEIIVAV